MRNLKRHIVILLLAVFTIGSTAGAVMAHCGHDAYLSGDGAKIVTGDSAEKECASNDYGQAAIETSSSHDMDHGSNHAFCDDCSGVPCHSQIQVPDAGAPAKCVEANSIHSKSDLKLKPIYLSIFPEPPKQIS